MTLGEKPASQLAELGILTPEEAAALAPYLARRELQKGEILCREGEHGDFTALILSGRLEEKKATEFADKKFVVGVYGKGAFIGESSLFGECAPLTAACLEPAILLGLCRENFRRLQQDNPTLALRVSFLAARSLALRLRKAFERMAAIF